MGTAARLALVKACRGSSPAISTTAARILLMLPWDKTEDPEEVRTELKSYGGRDEAERIATIGRLAAIPLGAGRAALLRLVMEEPSEDVCWQILTSLRELWSNDLLPGIQQLDPPDGRPAALVLAGRAWQATDRARMLSLFRRAVESEARHPTNDNGEMAVVYETLAEVAVAAGHYDEAAKLRRQQAAHPSATADAADAPPPPVYHLFVLHARYGPLQGFDQDLQAFSDNLGDPAVLYALSRVYSRSGRSIEAMALEAAARAAALTTDTHYQLAVFFRSIGWDTFARQQAYAAAAAAVGADDKTLSHQISARCILAMLASNSDENDPAAADHFSAARELLNKVGALAPQAETLAQDLDAQVALRLARIARAKGDDTEFRQQLEKSVSLVPGLTPADQSEIVLNLYPLLKLAGRDTDAKGLFDQAYAVKRQELEASHQNPVQMNDLAWMCARCDQKLTEALDLANRAVAAEPEDAAFLDTLAEVHFRMGNASESVKLETRALQLRPEDEFMQRQLERFRAGANQGR